MKTFQKIISALLIGGASLALSTHALASETTIAYAADGTPTTVVKAADLDLDKLGDVQTLYERVQDAARTVCAAELRAHVTAPSGWSEKCVKDAVEGAVRQVDNELLTVVHRGAPHRLVRL